MSNYTYKRIESNLYGDLVYLYKSAFGQDISLDYYQHKFNTNYLGITHLGFIAYDDKNAPAAFYGVYPYLMEYKGKNYLAAQSGDTMTHPAHGGRGLFTTLAKMTYELAKNEGIQFIFGFPNENSYPGFVKKLNWTHRENMSNYKFRVATIPLAPAAKKFPWLKPLYSAYCKIILSFYKSHSAFQPSSVINSTYGSVVRNGPYHNYKSFYNNYLVQLSGRTAWIKVDGALLVGDVELPTENNVTKLVASLKTLAFWLGCTQIIFPVGKETAWDLLLKQSYSPEEGIYIGYLDLQSGLPLENFKFVLADFDTF